MIFALSCYRRVFSSAFVLLCLGFQGCSKPAKPLVPAKQSQASSKLRVLVVDDPGIAAGLKLLRGEWVERSGGEIDIQEGTSDDVLENKPLLADVVIYPSRYVGAFVMRDAIRPVRKSVLESDEVALADTYPAVRHNVLRYGGQTYALTLGDAPLMLSVKTKPSPPLSRFNDDATPEVPTTWEASALDRIPPAAAAKSQLKTPHATELIVRALSYGHGRLLFDPNTMEPLVQSEPLKRALNEVIRNPAANSKINLKLGWLEPPKKDQSETVVTQSFSLLPLAKETYNSTREKWIENESTEPLAVFGLAGRSLSVSKTTRNAASAFKLIKWLSSDEIAVQLSPRSAATVWFRRTQKSRCRRWLEDRGNDATAEQINSLLSSRNVFLLPRIPGIDEYLAAMEDSINEMIPMDRTVEETLADIAANWNEITDRYGRDRQRVAYRSHLGLDETGE